MFKNVNENNAFAFTFAQDKSQYGVRTEGFHLSPLKKR